MSIQAILVDGAGHLRRVTLAARLPVVSWPRECRTETWFSEAHPTMVHRSELAADFSWRGQVGGSHVYIQDGCGLDLFLLWAELPKRHEDYRDTLRAEMREQIARATRGRITVVHDGETFDAGSLTYCLHLAVVARKRT